MIEKAKKKICTRYYNVFQKSIIVPTYKGTRDIFTRILLEKIIIKR